MEPKDEGRGSTITLCHAPLKKAVLHRKMAIVRIFFRLTVFYVGYLNSSITKYLVNCEHIEPDFQHMSPGREMDCEMGPTINQRGRVSKTKQKVEWMLSRHRKNIEHWL